MNFRKIFIFLGIVYLVIFIAAWINDRYASNNKDIREIASVITIWTDESISGMNINKQKTELVYSDVEIKIEQVSPGEIMNKLTTESLPNLLFLRNKENIEALRYASSDHSIPKLLIIPADTVPAALYYNKSLFDRFGIPYPDDGKPLAWEELMELAVSLTRYDEEKQYLGFSFSHPFTYTYNAPPVPLSHRRETQEDIVKESEWKEWVLSLKQLLDAGYQKFTAIPFTDSKNLFIRERSLAMWAGEDILADLASMGSSSLTPNIEQEALNWGIAPFPHLSADDTNSTLKNASGPSQDDTAPAFFIPAESDQTIESLLVLSEFLREKRIRTKASIVEVARQLHNKNFMALFHNHLTPVQACKKDSQSELNQSQTIETACIRDYLRSVFLESITGEADINTALRIAWERYEKIETAVPE